MLLFRGGYLGVDIFLVVSGFLICTSILNSLALPNHQFSLIHFYKRRFYRLSLPLIPLIIFCAVLGYFVLAPSIFKELLIETYKSLTFLSNQYFARQGGYFALNSLDKILLHTWYLSLIGQFYVIFPLVVLLINKLLGQRNLKSAIFSLTIFTFVYAEQKFILTKADNLYYLSTMRAWELLLGASLAFIKVNLNHKKLWFYIGVSLLTAQIILTKDQNYNPLATLFVILATSLVIIANYQDSRLNNRVVQFIGKSSYSLYLWHWPIMVFCSRLMIFEATWFVVSLILISWILSYLFEKVNIKYFLVIATIYCLLGISSLSSFVLMKYCTNIGFDKFDQLQDLRAPWQKFEGNGKLKQIIVDATRPINILMLGDSNLRHYLAYFASNINFKYIELSGSINYGKNVQITTNKFRSKEFEKLEENCKKALNSMHEGSKVIIANRWAQYAFDKIKQTPNSDIKVSDKFKNDIMAGIIADLENLIVAYPNFNFYLISQPVQPKIQNLNAVLDLYSSNSNLSIFLREVLNIKLKDNFKPVNIAVVQKLNSYLKNLSNKYEYVYFIDRNKPICSTINNCSLIINSKPIYADIDHLSVYGGQIVGEYILRKIEFGEVNKIIK